MKVDIGKQLSPKNDFAQLNSVVPAEREVTKIFEDTLASERKILQSAREGIYTVA
jgi:hypothetical protein